MKIERDGADAFVVYANADELTLLNNALNEICNGLDLRDFQTRVGVTREEAESVLAVVHKALVESRLS
jgi:hypothetical protein